MTNTERMAFIMTVHNAIFASKEQNTNIETVVISNPAIVPTQYSKGQGRTFVNGTIRGFDISLNVGNKVIPLRFMEQNPNKTLDGVTLTKYAILARRGHKIMWVIDQNSSFLGRIQDGQWHASEQRAYSPTPPQQQHTETHENQPYDDTGLAAQNQSAEEIPDVVTGIPEYVLAYYAEHGDTEAPE